MAWAHDRIKRRIIAAVLALAVAVSACAVLGLTRDEVLFASAQGTRKAESGSMIVDISNASKGYIMVKSKMTTTKDLKLRIIYEGRTTYTYNLPNDGQYHCYPLQRGKGTYDVVLYVQVKGTTYNQQSARSVNANIRDNLSVFLHPNLYAWYTKDSNIVQVALDMNEGLKGQQEIVDAVKEYVRRNLTYDHFFALQVKRGYMPDVDKVLEKNKGICFDYAAVTVSLLRIQGIPARLCMGDADGAYHAWVSYYIDNAWHDYDPTYAASGKKVKAYTLEAYY